MRYYEAQLQKVLQASKEEAQLQKALDASKEEAELQKALDASRYTHGISESRRSYMRNTPAPEPEPAPVMSAVEKAIIEEVYRRSLNVPDARRSSSAHRSPRRSSSAHRSPRRRSSAHRSPRRSSQPPGYRFVKVKGDGACLFRAISIGDDPSLEIDKVRQDATAAKLRAEVVAHICAHWGGYNDYVQAHTGPYLRYVRDQARSKEGVDAIGQRLRRVGMTKDEYSAYMLDPSSHGDQPEIRALNYILKRPIVVHSLTTGMTSVHKERGNGIPAIHIRHNGDHYDVYVPLRARHNKQTKKTKKRPKKRPEKTKKRSRKTKRLPKVR